jgi:hypothetical protein
LLLEQVVREVFKAQNTQNTDEAAAREGRRRLHHVVDARDEPVKGLAVEEPEAANGLLQPSLVRGVITTREERGGLLKLTGAEHAVAVEALQTARRTSVTRWSPSEKKSRPRQPARVPVGAAPFSTGDLPQLRQLQGKEVARTLSIRFYFE